MRLQSHVQPAKRPQCELPNNHRDNEAVCGASTHHYAKDIWNFVQAVKMEALLDIRDNTDAIKRIAVGYLNILKLKGLMYLSLFSDSDQPMFQK